MKKFSFSILATLAFLFFVTTLMAQQPVTPAKAAKKQSAAPASATEKQSGAATLPYCDQVAGYYGPDLQKRANQECRTIHPCIDCIDKKTQKQTCQQVTLHPDNSAPCGIAVTAVAEAKNPSSSHTPLDQNDFALSIIQTPCYFDGVTLKVLANRMVSTMPDSPKDYTYTWSVDNQPMGSANYVYCVSGRMATVKVTQNATGNSKTTSVVISHVEQPGLNNKKPSVENKPIAGYQKTSCFGECPSYSVEIFNDGSVVWNGRAFTLPLGQKRGKVSAEIIAAIQEKARAIGFLKLNNTYPEEQIADAQATIVYLRLNGQDKQVTDIFEAPKGLDELEKMFDDLIRKQGWAKAKSPAPMQKKLEDPNKGNKASGN